MSDFQSPFKPKRTPEERGTERPPTEERRRGVPKKRHASVGTTERHTHPKEKNSPISV